MKGSIAKKLDMSFCLGKGPGHVTKDLLNWPPVRTGPEGEVSPPAPRRTSSGDVGVRSSLRVQLLQLGPQLIWLRCVCESAPSSVCSLCKK